MKNVSLVTSITAVALTTIFTVTTVFSHVTEQTPSTSPTPTVSQSVIDAHYARQASETYNVPVRKRLQFNTVKHLAGLIYHETRENPITRFEVDIVFNRVLSPHYPNNVYDVIYQVNSKGVAQFSYLTKLKHQGRDIFKSMDAEPYERDKAFRVAARMLSDFYSGKWEPDPRLKDVVYYVNEDKLPKDKHGNITTSWVDLDCAVPNIPSKHTFLTCHKNA